ncbi:MAG: hypothetical protein L3K19_07105 [Thermoplasmata archaeon]|nr:hypothetical protein [Thermoplasmata archaeon]
MLRRKGLRAASAFAPGHVTGIFAPASVGSDPRGRGSVGAGIVLELGVVATATLEPERPRRILVRSSARHELSISRTVAERLLARRRGRLTVDLVHQLPIGQGFGMSAAGATATGLAVARLLDLDPRKAVETAHLADLFGGGGLGGVAAILGGGLEFRRRPGLPPRGLVRHYPFPRSLWIGVVGRPIASRGLLRDPTFLAHVVDRASEGLTTLRQRPTVATFLAESEAFGDRLGLAPPALSRLLLRIRSEGIRASQAMFGRSFFAVPPSEAARTRLIEVLQAAGVRAVELGAAPAGAHVIG